MLFWLAECSLQLVGYNTCFLECLGGYGHFPPNPCEGVKQTNRPMYSKLVSDIYRTIEISRLP